MSLRILFAAIFLMCAGLACAETTLKAEVDKTSISADETVTFKLTITTSERSLPAPSLPALKDFSVLSSAQSSTTTFQQGQIKIFVVYAFVLTPLRTGELVIPPATITSGKDVYTSAPITVTVKEGASSPDQSGPQPPESDEPQYIL
jgi:hypothetical protein